MLIFHLLDEHIIQFREEGKSSYQMKSINTTEENQIWNLTYSSKLFEEINKNRNNGK
jgi:hypothetical protein